ncbi:MAG: RNA polymerase sigma factor [Aquihabitans sp.]
MTGTARGDDEAWEDVYRRVYPRLFAFSRRRLGSDHEADDVVAEVMTRAITGSDRFRPSTVGIDGWLFGICRNVLRETWRSHERDGRWHDVGGALVPLADDGPLDQVLRREERDRLVRAFARLDADERELLELRVTAGLDAAAVGEVLGKQPGAVRMAQARALTRLRTFLEEVT